jgi:hypothetical protein
MQQARYSSSTTAPATHVVGLGLSLALGLVARVAAIAALIKEGARRHERPGAAIAVTKAERSADLAETRTESKKTLESGQRLAPRRRAPKTSGHGVGD